ncbi:MAG: hypothetical protein R3F13_18230 [Prosthecobacter sp.]
MKTNANSKSSTLLPLLIGAAWLLLSGSGFAGNWVQLNAVVKGSHEAHSGSSSKESHQRWLEVGLSGIGLKQDADVRLEWVFYADDLAEHKLVEQAKGVESVTLSPGKAATVKTKEVSFEYERQHSERQGSGRRARFKLVEGSGQRYHGWAVKALIGDEVVGEAVSSRDISSINNP